MLGSDVFQHGVEAYLRENAWKTATATDLIRSLTKASGKDVATLAATFLDRPGVPNLTFSVDCKTKEPSLTLSQAPWHLFGDGPAAGSPPVTPWVIPVDLRLGQEEHRIQLATATGTYPLAKCPTWVDPNIGGFGYYRYSLDEKGWASFAGVIAKQDEAARLQFVESLWAQVRSGTLAPEVLLRHLPALDGETSRVVVDAEIDVLTQFAHELVSPAAAPGFAAYVSARLLPHQRAILAHKPAPKAPPNEDDVLERRALFAALGWIANDPATLAEANKLTLAWLADPTSVDGDLARVAVPLGSRRAGPERIDALRAAMKAAKNPNDRKTALLGLSGFDDPGTLGKALAVALTDDVATQDVGILLLNAAHHPSTQEATTAWVMSNWDAVRAKLPGFLSGRAFGLAGRACTQADVDRAKAFFTPKTADVEGSARPLAEGLESASLCAALHEKDSGAVDKFFKGKGAAPAKPAADVMTAKPVVIPAKAAAPKPAKK